jgi:hypothetical protein
MKRRKAIQEKWFANTIKGEKKNGNEHKRVNYCVKE